MYHEHNTFVLLDYGEWFLVNVTNSASHEARHMLFVLLLLQHDAATAARVSDVAVNDG